MERKEFRELIKKKFKSMGFKSTKSYWYKIIDDDYLVSFGLEPSTYGKLYQMCCGFCYLPDENVFPFDGYVATDREWNFLFPREAGGKLDLSEYDFNLHPGAGRNKYTVYFEYELYTEEQFEELFEINYRYIFEPMLTKGYGLDYFTVNVQHLNGITHGGNIKLKKICKILGLDVYEIAKILKKPEGWLER